MGLKFGGWQHQHTGDDDSTATAARRNQQRPDPDLVISIHCRHATCLGARHRSRGEPCQDAARSYAGVAADGTPYGLLVVADGHGHPLHSRSDVGAHLACELTETLVRNQVEHVDSTASEWPSWCQHKFPALLHQQWLSAVAQHSLERSDQEPADPIAYGTTLGMVLLTPSWWVCAGLGDWDLVAITATNQALVSEECSDAAPGESTFSLCQKDPFTPMSERFAMHRVDETSKPIRLVLCTDGIRKSCRNDSDFVQLCRHLLDLEPNSISDQKCLTRITEQGSRDDVSFAIGTSTADGSRANAH